MKKNMSKKNYLYKDEWNSIYVDYDNATKIARKLDKECIALKDEKMGYGIYFTKDGDFGSYGDNPYSEELMRTYLDGTKEETEMHLEYGRTKENLVRTGIIKLVACTLNYRHNEGLQ